jgi:hypothetical protein
LLTYNSLLDGKKRKGERKIALNNEKEEANKEETERGN